MGKTIGIDLGTTNSCVAVLEGKEAKVITNPVNTVFGVKRLIGRKFDAPEVQRDRKVLPYTIEKAENGDVRIALKDKRYSPAEISSFILSHIKKYAEDCVFRDGYTLESILEMEEAKCPLVRDNIVIEVPAA